MSKQAIEEFLIAAKNDEAIRAELEASQSEDAFATTAVRLGAARGLTFTKDEVSEATRPESEGELSESALAGVAGGLAYTIYFQCQKSLG